MDQDSKDLGEVLDEFLRLVDDLWGMYFDLRRATGLYRDWLVQVQKRIIEELKTTSPQLANLNYLDTTSFTLWHGDPSQEDAELLVERTQGEVKRVNEESGPNIRFLGNMWLVVIYEFWESRYRGAIAACLDKERDDVKASLMGDLRLIRHSILHNNGVANSRVAECEKLQWYSPGDQIFIDEDKVEEIVREIRVLAATLRQEPPAQ